MKLFVPFATLDNGVYASEEKRAEVVPGERAKVLARSQHESCASGWRLPRANRFSRHDVNYYTSPRYPRCPPSPPGSGLAFARLALISSSGQRIKRARAKGSDFISL